VDALGVAGRRMFAARHGYSRVLWRTPRRFSSGAGKLYWGQDWMHFVRSAVERKAEAP
jgi:hypothetical protein